MATPSIVLRMWGRKRLETALGAAEEPPPTSVSQLGAGRHPGARGRPGGLDLFAVAGVDMTQAVERMGQAIAKSQQGLTRGLELTLAPLAANQQRMEDTMAFQKRKAQGKKDLNNLDKAKLKGYANVSDIRYLQSFWRKAVKSDGWQEDEKILRKLVFLWTGELGMEIDPNIYVLASYHYKIL